MSSTTNAQIGSGLVAAANAAAEPLLGAVRLPVLRNRFAQIALALEVLLDWGATLVAVLCAFYVYHLLHLGKGYKHTLSVAIVTAALVATVMVVLLDRAGAYRESNSLLRIRESERLLRVTTQVFALGVVVNFFSARLFPRWIAVLSYVLILAFTLALKQVFFATVNAAHTRGLGLRRLVIYGAGFTGMRLFSALARSPKLGLSPVAIIDDGPEMQGVEIFELNYRRERSLRVEAGPISAGLLRRVDASVLVVAVPSLSHEKFVAAAAAAAEAGATFAFVPSMSVLPDAMLNHADIDGVLLATSARMDESVLYVAAKRLLDVFGALVILLLSSPLWMVIAALIRLESPGRAFFLQTRVGKNGKLFRMWKFRSMRSDAPAYAFSPNKAVDERITRVGRWLRRTSLDELPQLLNVLKGDMSLVGPRPEMPFIVEQYTPLQRHRLVVKPGMTGLWQLSADRAFLIHENINYDFYYIKNRNLFMDIAILLHTALFAMRGI